MGDFSYSKVINLNYSMTSLWYFGISTLLPVQTWTLLSSSSS